MQSPNGDPFERLHLVGEGADHGTREVGALPIFNSIVPTEEGRTLSVQRHALQESLPSSAGACRKIGLPDSFRDVDNFLTLPVLLFTTLDTGMGAL
jgi:hypothetical protein